MKPERLKRLLFHVGVTLGTPTIHLLFSLNKHLVLNGAILTDALAAGRSVLLCCWHGRLLFPFYFLRGRGGRAMAGLHADAEVISRIGDRMGWKMIRGSTTEGGRGAYQELIDTLSKGGSLAAITPDGPKGPQHRVKPGAVRAAMLTGAVVIPVSGQASRRWEIRNWDTFIVPKPWGKTCMVFGKPIEMNRKSSFRANSHRLEKELNRIQEAVDAAVIDKT
ncbi:MAG: lysophospholipid acyltransferase family protein [Candidatus Neomarinimicrobiota bacterium]